MIEIAKVKVGSINDQIITWLWNVDATGVICNDGFRVCIGIRVEIAAYKTRESDAVIIGIMPCADNRKDILNSGSIFKIIADGSICLQFGQKIIRIRDVAAPLNVGNLIVLTNNTLEDLESAVTVEFVEVLLSVVCKHRDRHGAHHGNCQQSSHEFLHYFFHGKSPFLFFAPCHPPAFLCGGCFLFGLSRKLCAWRAGYQPRPAGREVQFSHLPSLRVCACGG